MIEHLSARVRMILIQCRCSAMSGNAMDALSRLKSEIESLPYNCLVVDRVALLMLQAEIHYLEYCYEEAHSVFTTINPYLEQLKVEERLVVEDNRNCVMMRGMLPEGHSSFYRLYDERKLAGISIWSKDRIIIARDAAAKGKHYEALPGYWQQFVCSYREGYWRAFLWASEAMGRECLSLGWLDEAAHHAVIAEDKELLTSIGKAILTKRDSIQIERTVLKLLSNANLQHHAANACFMLAEIGDAVPTGQIDTLVNWLLPWANINPNNWSKINTFNNAWDAIKSIAHQLNADQARRVINTAINHEAWNTAHRSRKHLIEAAHYCLAALPTANLPELINKTIPLATSTKSDLDYVNAINLMCGIASRADENLKTALADALYPPGAGTANSILVQVAPLFGKKKINRKQIADWVVKIEQGLRQQVQRLEPDQEPVEVPGSMGKITTAKNGAKVVVFMTNHHDIAALAKHRRAIPPKSVKDVIQAILAMAVDEDNTFSDSALLIHRIGEFADVLSEETAEVVLAKLSPIANGSVAASTMLQDEFNPDNPLNPFKIRTGEFSQVRGTALMTLAAIEKAKPGIYGERLNPVIENALTSEDGTVRLWGFKAAGQMPTFSKSILTAVLLGTRDPDPNIAAWAFDALKNKPELQIEEEYLHSLLYSLTMAVQSPNVSIRRVAASVIAIMKDRITDAHIVENIARLTEILATDISYSVRMSLADTKITPVT